jgi:gamma-glutamylcyclotransferase (GGCT)/AIG2-like uncharacterized protein YtfP
MKLKNKHTEYLFVYGSLRRDAEHDVFSKVKTHLQYIGQGYFSGLLFDLGKYPGAVESTEDDSSKVKGEVYAIEDHRNDVFRTLDKYEGYNREKISKSLFVRKRTIIQLRGGKEVTVWIYLYNRPEQIQKAKLISSGDYLRVKNKMYHA